MPLLTLPRARLGNRAPRPPARFDRSSPQARALVAAYPLNTPGRIADLTGRQAAGLAKNGATWSPSEATSGFVFDTTGGATAHADLGDIGTFGEVAGAPFSMAIWGITSETGNDRWWLARGNTANDTPALGLINQNGVGRAFLRGSTSVQAFGTRAINDGRPHLIVGTWDGSTIRLYVDGALEGTDSGTPGARTFDTTTIGLLSRVSLGLAANGLFWGARFATVAWTPAEIRQMYQAGSRWDLYRGDARVFVPAAGGAAATTRTSSLEALVRKQQQKIADMGAALRATRTVAGSAEAAVASQRLSAVQGSAAIVSTAARLTSLDTTLSRSGLASAALQATVRRTIRAGAGLDAHVSAEGVGLRQAALDAILAALTAPGSGRNFRVPPGQRSAAIADQRRFLS